MAQTTSEKAEAEAREDAGIATPKENARLKHSVEVDADRTPGPAEKGAKTTRDDPLDQGVPMLQGSPAEPQGPEDAFGEGQKRGDYGQRVGAAIGMAESHEAVRVADADVGDPWVRDDDGNPVDRKPLVELHSQTHRASDQGEVEGKKGGVDTA